MQISPWVPKMKNYYNSQIKKIQKFISFKDYKSALNIVEDELKTPYVPLKYEKQFKILKLQISSKIDTNNKILTFSSIAEDVLKKCFENDKLFYKYQNFFEPEFFPINLKLYKQEIIDIMYKPKANYFFKSEIIKILYYQNHTFVKNITKGHITKTFSNNLPKPSLLLQKNSLLQSHCHLLCFRTFLNH